MRPPDIFISYAQADRDQVRPLADALAINGWTVWWDPEIRAGQQFHNIIERALTESACVVVVWSKHSVLSRWVLAEADDGANRNILVPILLEEVAIPIAFRGIHSANFVNWSGDVNDPVLQTLIRDIEVLLGYSSTSALSELVTLGKTPADRDTSVLSESVVLEETSAGTSTPKHEYPKLETDNIRSRVLLKRLCFFFLATGLVIGSWWLQANLSRDHKIALLQQGCDGGDATSCTNLGIMYEEGKSVAVDHSEALTLYRKSCDGGDAEACTNLGFMYYSGIGVAQDVEKAMSLYHQGCDGGDIGACSNIDAVEIIQSIGR